MQKLLFTGAGQFVRYSWNKESENLKKFEVLVLSLLKTVTSYIVCAGTFICLLD